MYSFLRFNPVVHIATTLLETVKIIPYVLTNTPFATSVVKFQTRRLSTKIQSSKEL
jgi:hypothetical protein